ncbi:MAG TPA: thiol reductant ABC exporter subunit CydC [Patescibacteria group bacterium]|nr:thiol reductant ABC exporter subunit CydC [Patescibacteria group bacterium]
MREQQKNREEPVQRFWKILRQEWRVVAVATVLGTLTAGAGTGLMAVSAWLIATAALQPSVAELAVAIVGVRFFGVVRAVLRYLERYISHDAVFRLLGALRVWFYQTLEPLIPGSLPGLERGDLAGRLVADVETLQYFYLRVLFPGLAALLTAAIALAAAAIWGGLGVAVSMLGLFVTAGLLVPYGVWSWSRREGIAWAQTRDYFRTVLADTLEGIGELALADAQPAQLLRLCQAEEEMQQAQRRLRQGTFRGTACSRIALDITVIGLIFFCIPLVRTGDLPGVWLPVTALAVQSLTEILLPLAQSAHYLAQSRLALARLFGIGYAGPEGTVKNCPLTAGVAAVPVINSAGPVLPVIATLRQQESALPALQVINLCFRYRQTGALVLEPVTFSLAAGQRLTIVGPSGAGKSTLAGLLTGLLKPLSGTIYLNGVDMLREEPERLRSQWGVLPQDPYVFDASVEDNIRLARPDADERELRQALTAAGLDDWWQQLPQGLGTRIGQNGLAVSGGERQRLGLARVLLKNAPFLLLDEPAAGLDALTRRLVAENWRQAMEGKTVVTITHRLTDLAATDEVLVLARGRLTGMGQWSCLLRRNDIVGRMWEAQRDAIDSPSEI